MKQDYLDYFHNGSNRYQVMRKARDAAYQTYLEADRFANRALRRFHKRAALRRFNECEAIMQSMNRYGKACPAEYLAGQRDNSLSR